MRILLMGPPGAGKGTQATRLSVLHGVPAVSTGDIFRSSVAEGNELGRAAKRYLDAGEYVPDEVTDAMVRDRISRADCRGGFVLDGYPRTPLQVKELDRMLADLRVALDHVLVLSADTEVLVGRLLRRAELEGRTDDTEPVIRRRQEVYLEQTAPLVGEYAARGLLTAIDGLGDPGDVTGRIRVALGAEA